MWPINCRFFCVCFYGPGCLFWTLTLATLIYVVPLCLPYSLSSMFVLAFLVKSDFTHYISTLQEEYTRNGVDLQVALPSLLLTPGRLDGPSNIPSVMIMTCTLHNTVCGHVFCIDWTNEQYISIVALNVFCVLSQNVFIFPTWRSPWLWHRRGEECAPSSMMQSDHNRILIILIKNVYIYRIPYFWTHLSIT